MNFDELKNQFLRVMRGNKNTLKLGIRALLCAKCLDAVMGLFWSLIIHAGPLLYMLILGGSNLLQLVGSALLAHNFYTLYRDKKEILYLVSCGIFGLNIIASFPMIELIAIIVFAVALLRQSDEEKKKKTLLLLGLSVVSVFLVPSSLYPSSFSVIVSAVWIAILILLCILISDELDSYSDYQDETEMLDDHNSSYNLKNLFTPAMKSSGVVNERVNDDVNEKLPISDEMVNVISAASAKKMQGFGTGSWNYKTVAAPIATRVNSNQDYEKGVRGYAAILDKEAVDGWVFSHIQQIPVIKKPGILGTIMGKESKTAFFNMLVFKIENNYEI